jgi:hypothetical protein
MSFEGESVLSLLDEFVPDNVLAIYDVLSVTNSNSAEDALSDGSCRGLQYTDHYDAEAIVEDTELQTQTKCNAGISS